ncbi:hypothetical protein PAF17_01695 [Paracoccus sp. Z330]|uniref:Sulfotransferase domain-containing protein n=1 Tax=Paracoccus onchidii TaxID=3017813 RepID=A0ABT4ZA37_9RHOB|nr:hypothetical protein [Paracoccus onchidii]MDB6176214.1 hypothetical protein [Paracoccus onchidii]
MERRFGSLEQLRTQSEQSWEEFEAEIHEKRFDTVIVSSEDIPAAKQRDELLERFKKSFDRITGVFYFRDPVDLYVSEINQRIRHGLRLRQTPTPRDYKFRHLEFADWFTSSVGHNALIARNFNRQNLVGGDAVEDFFGVMSKICGFTDEFDIPEVPVNQSLPGAATVWMYSFNEILDRRFRNVNKKILERRSEVVKQLRKSEAVMQHGKLKLDDPQLQSIIRQNADADIRQINEKYLAGQVPLKTDSNPPVDLTTEQARERMREWLLGYMTPDAVSSIARELLS